MRKYLSTTFVALAAIGLGGCVYKRLWNTHQLLCTDHNLVTFSVLHDGSKALEFHHTSLLADDVAWLLGKAPTSVETDENGVVHEWTAHNANAAEPDRYRIRVGMDFENEDDGLYLKRIRVPQPLASVMSANLLEQTIRAACDVKLKLWSKGVVFDLSEIHDADIPDPATLRQALGEPIPSSTDTRLDYRFCIEPCSQNPESADHAVVRMRYSATGAPESYYLKYLRYEANADMVNKQGLIRLVGD